MSHLPSAPIRHIRRFSFFMRVIQFFRRIAPRNSFEEYIPLPRKNSDPKKAAGPQSWFVFPLPGKKTVLQDILRQDCFYTIVAH